VVAKDAGRRLKVLVTATRAGGGSGQATSEWIRIARA
jgi:hypothetical protein